MTRQEKLAWFNLSVAVATVAAYLSLLPVLGPMAAVSAFALSGLWGFSVFFYRLPATAPGVVYDERDIRIHSRATLVAYSVFWVVFVGACMGWWALRHGEGTVSISILPVLPMIGMLVVISVQSVAMLLQYRWDK